MLDYTEISSSSASKILIHYNMHNKCIIEPNLVLRQVLVKINEIR